MKKLFYRLASSRSFDKIIFDARAIRREEKSHVS